ncbi:MAG TPA: chromosome partitioning protein ParA, partial [Novosphingobium sp.]|nr:chromosome partitioning protein ParA [Novosphingobium sp.]
MNNPKDDTAALRAALPPLAQSRLQSLRLKNDLAIVVLEAGGFDALERERLEAAVKEALAGKA